MFHTGRSDVATQEIATNTAKTDSVKAKIIAAGELYDRSRKIGATEPTPPRACLVAEDPPRSVNFRWKAVVAPAGAVERKLTDIKL